MIWRRLARIESRLGRLEKEVRTAQITDARFLSLARQVEGRTLLGLDRLWVLWQAVQNVANLGLPAAEVGAYRGGSAAFLAGAFLELGGKETALEVVDTFEGHPESKVGERDSSYHQPGHFGDTSYEDVRAYLSGFQSVRVHKGEFSTVSLPEGRYGLVHIDLDLYQSTLDCLRFFGERLPAEGVMVVDDYGAKKCPGVKLAVESYMREVGGFQLWDPLTQQAVLSRKRSA